MLHIEDNPNSLRLVEKLVEQRPQVRLLTAHSGLGYELAEKHPVDLILLDLNLPDLSGAEVLQLLLGNPATSNIPVVIMSADASPSTILKLKTAGAYDFMTKPIEVKRFLALLDEFLENYN